MSRIAGAQYWSSNILESKIEKQRDLRPEHRGLEDKTHKNWNRGGQRDICQTKQQSTRLLKFMGRLEHLDRRSLPLQALSKFRATQWLLYQFFLLNMVTIAPFCKGC